MLRATGGTIMRVAWLMRAMAIKERVLGGHRNTWRCRRPMRRCLIRFMKSLALLIWVG